MDQEEHDQVPQHSDGVCAQEHGEEQLLELGISGEAQEFECNLLAQVCPFHISPVPWHEEQGDHLK